MRGLRCRLYWMFTPCAGVVKLADARDSKSRGVHSPCRFDSDLRHHIYSGNLSILLAGCSW